MKSRSSELFAISVLGLFFELLLIRWIGTEIRIFAYLQNTVLVVCFLGLGMGCFSSREPIRMVNALIAASVLLLLMSIPVSKQLLQDISLLLSVLGELVIWDGLVSSNPLQTVLCVFIGLALTVLLMFLIWEMFLPIGRLLGRLMDDHPHTIWAYSVNVAGSIAGIWLFVGLSALSQPPFVWFVVTAALFLYFLPRMGVAGPRALAVAAVFLVLAWFGSQEQGALEVYWSPYQKLSLRKEFAPREASLLGVTSGSHRGVFGKDSLLITVNNTGYQTMLDLSDEHVAAHPERFPEEMRGLSQYDLPALFHPAPRSMLIVGAGSGNDAAGALRNGVERVVAVEIDPVIIDIGKRHHREKPYSSPKVVVINDDARSYFATAKEQFDVITFGLLDSHTTTAMTNARLDHYVYTRESIARARSLLKAGGVMVLTFEAQKPFIADRMARLLMEEFGEEPIAFRIPGSAFGGGGVMFIAGELSTARAQIAGNPQLAQAIEHWAQLKPLGLSFTTPVTTDDWPYIYLARAQIPTLYFLLAVLMFVLLLYGRRRLGAVARAINWERSHWHFFFLGAAFLLLEVQNISKASVVLGSTWLVNAVVITAILCMILLANVVQHLLPRILILPVYACLLGSCVGLYFVDIAEFAFLPYTQKAVVVGLLTTLPMLFSGIVFIRSFAAAAHKDGALGANLVGALVGGLLQSITFVTGVKALLLVVAALYAAAVLTAPRRVIAAA